MKKNNNKNKFKKKFNNLNKYKLNNNHNKFNNNNKKEINGVFLIIFKTIKIKRLIIQIKINYLIDFNNYHNSRIRCIKNLNFNINL